MRGTVERNTMRYYLAIEAYLDSLDKPPAQQLDARLRQWFDATEQYARQLHEVDKESYLAMQQDLLDAGAQCKLVAPHLGTVSTSSGRQLAVDHTFTNMPSVMFDAVLIPGGSESAATLGAM